MSMTKEEAIKYGENKLTLLRALGYNNYYAPGEYIGYYDEFSFVTAALSALRHQIWEEKLWHDAKTDPPKTPGLYYGKKDDTNSMYPCLYRDGIWVLDAYPQTKMDIVKWADYTAFVKEDD